MKYKAIIFDLDGVIVSTDQYHYKAWKTIADQLNVYFDSKINHRLRGVGRMESLELILERSERQYSQSEKIRIAKEKNEIYKDYIKQMSKKDVTKEVCETLQELKERDLKLAIASSSKNATFILKQIGLFSFFDEISDGNNITQSKPDPEVFLNAANLLKLPPNDCLVVEDAEVGIKAALAGKMDCAAIGDAVRYHMATFELKNFNDLLDVLN